ncbi:MAG: hypothetical protein J7501_12945, partial [Bdellovibrio sp.]|nr:hypothetical protein [Bdellovibrio sp.]
MPVQNIEVAQTFTQLADLLEIQGANPFRVRAYRTAAQTLIELPENVYEIVENHGKLEEYPGIGKDLATKIQEILETGHLEALDEVQAHLPKGLLEMLQIPRVGPKRVKLLYDKLKIESIEELRKAAESKAILKIRGFGEKTRLEILEGIQKLEKEEKKKTPLAQAEKTAAEVCGYLLKAPGIQKVTAAGSLRRLKEEVADLDIVVTAKKPEAVMDHLLRYENVAKVVSKGKTRSTVNLRTGMQVDVRVVADESYGAALLYFTGSKAHNIELRAMAQKRKLKINEYGVFKGAKSVASKTEKEIYEYLGLSYIEPELRENRGEIEAAGTDKLPRLLKISDIAGDLHIHLASPDQSLIEIAQNAQRRGYSYIGVSGKSSKEIDQANSKLRDFQILKTAKVAIREDGSLSLPEKELSQLDYTICYLADALELSREKQTDRVLRAMENPYFTILSRPTGRLVGDGYS